MKYPHTLNHKLAEVKQIVASWSISVSAEEVIKWMMQFDNADFDLAFRIVKNLNIIGVEDLKNALHVAYGKLERRSIDKGTKINSKNTLFAGVGDSGKSGAMIGYNFRLINELSEENFLDEESLRHIEAGRIENIVLVDDIISSGMQATKEVKKLTETLVPLGVKNFFLLTAVGMKEGIKRIEMETGAYVFSAYEYDIDDTIQSFDSQFYEGLSFSARTALKERIEYYGRIASPKNPLGYMNVGGLIVFYYNTPNSTLPIIWSAMNAWIPLFKRATRINGINSYFKQFENLKSNKPKTDTNPTELTLFVEGKSDELFYELISHKLTKELGSKNINVISTGTGFPSRKLIENLDKNEKNYLFIIEQDRHTPPDYLDKQMELYKGKSFMLAPPIIEFLDIESVMKDAEISTFLPIGFRERKDFTARDFQRDFEMYLFKSMSSPRRKELLKKMVEQHLNTKMIDTLIHNMKVALKKIA